MQVGLVTGVKRPLPHKFGHADMPSSSECHLLPPILEEAGGTGSKPVTHVIVQVLVIIAVLLV